MLLTSSSDLINSLHISTQCLDQPSILSGCITTLCGPVLAGHSVTIISLTQSVCVSLPLELQIKELEADQEALPTLH